MIQINRDRCTGCGACIEACPSDAITLQDGFAQIILEHCTDCGACIEVCPQGAIWILPEASPQEITEVEGRPADRSQEVITVRLPPPTLVPPRPSPARQLGLALSAAMAYLGREVAPRLLRLGVDWVEERILTSQQAASRATPQQRGSASPAASRRASAGGQHRRRRRGGK